MGLQISDRYLMIANIISNLIGAFITVIANILPQTINTYKESRSVSTTKLDISNIGTKKTIDRLKIALSPIKGQDKAKNKILDIISGWTEVKENPENKLGGLIIHLAGPSGVGKTMAAKAITDTLIGNDSKLIKISYSCLDTESNKTVAEQLFGKTNDHTGLVPIKKNNILSKQLKYNANTVIQIDEFDKFMKKDDSLQAKLWDIADTGKLEVDGEFVDCSNTIFLLTSNSSRKSVGLDSDAADSLETDETKSITDVNYNQAFLNRIDTVYFDDFSLRDYCEILKQQLVSINNYYSNKFNLSVKISNENLEKIGKTLEDKKVGGARNIKPIVYKIYIALKQFRVENNINKQSNSEIKLVYIDYDETSQEFTAQGIITH